jgi:spore germination protein AC
MEDVTLSLGIGVDVTEEGLISVLNQVVVPPAQQGGSSSYNNVIGEGPTYHAAIRDVTTLEFPVYHPTSVDRRF